MKLHVVHVWDLPVRLFHWVLVGLVAFCWWSGEEGGVMLKYHMWSGYGIFGVLLFRLGWGFVGTRYARFATFVHGPRRVIASLAALWDRKPLDAAGHNPLGGWMILALLAVLAVQVGTGLFANDDLFNEGPLYAQVTKALSDRLTAIHHLNFKVLAVLVAIHVLAIVWHRWRKGERLVWAMITGRKQLPTPAAPAGRLPWAAALVLSAVSAAIVVAVVYL